MGGMIGLMLISMKNFKKMLDEESARYESQLSQGDEWGIKYETGALCGAESSFRPWELLHPGKSLYFAKGRELCEKNLDRAVNNMIHDFSCKRLEVTATGAFGKIALRVVAKYKEKYPDLKIRVWLPNALYRLSYAKAVEEFGSTDYRIAFFYCEDSFLRMNAAMMFRARLAVCFDASPRAGQRRDCAEDVINCGIFHLANGEIPQREKIEP